MLPDYAPSCDRIAEALHRIGELEAELAAMKERPTMSQLLVNFGKVERQRAVKMAYSVKAGPERVGYVLERFVKFCQKRLGEEAAE